MVLPVIHDLDFVFKKTPTPSAVTDVETDPLVPLVFCYILFLANPVAVTCYLLPFSQYSPLQKEASFYSETFNSLILTGVVHNVYIKAF